ncbi:EAL and HDOD domain-containing protein [Vreelandella aquamarina]|uniref:EAL and HDOD domain-containing protein n=1 Tax=Vreelandella aquamarina TaxID=77097 RepID=UPI00384C51B2
MTEKTALSNYGVALQPICNARFVHVADELLYRAKPGADFAQIDDPLLATARACTTAFYEVGLQALVGERRLFFNATAEWVNNPDIMPLPNSQLVAEVPTSLLTEPDVLEQLTQLRQQGYLICVDDTTLEIHQDAVLDSADFLKVDVRRKDAWEWPSRYQRESLTLIATFVENREQLEKAKQAGFQLFQGFVFAPPNHIQTPNKKRSSNPAVEMQLLAELALNDLDLEPLEKLLVQHPHLCQLIFKQLNSAAHANLVRTVSSLREAVQLLGARRLRALAAALSLSRNDPVQAVQLREVVIRAALCRNIASHLQDVEEGTAFTLGLLSLIGQIEGEPMESLLASVPLDDTVKKALLNREGGLGRLLNLVERFEQGSLNQVSGNVLSLLNDDYLKAVAWADSLINHSLNEA